MNETVMQHTRGPWRIGSNYGAIVADTPTGGPRGADAVEAYGGHMVCESVARNNMRLMPLRLNYWKRC